MKGSCFASSYLRSYLQSPFRLTDATTNPLPCIRVPFSVLGRRPSEADAGSIRIPVPPHALGLLSWLSHFSLPLFSCSLTKHLPTMPSPSVLCPLPSSPPSPFPLPPALEVWTQDPSSWWVLRFSWDPQEDLAPRTCSGRGLRGLFFLQEASAPPREPRTLGCAFPLCLQVPSGSTVGGASSSKSTGTMALPPG